MCQADARQARQGRDHHAGKQLHGGNVLLVEGIRSAGEHLKYTQGPAKVAQWSNQYRPHSQASATGQIDARIALRVMAKNYLSGSNAVCGNAGISLQPDTKIGAVRPVRARQTISSP